MQLVAVAVAAVKCLLPVKAADQPEREVKVNSHRNKRHPLYYRVQLPEGRRIIRSCTGFYTVPCFPCLRAQLQQQRAKVQQILRPEPVPRPGDFKYVKEKQRAQRQRPLQRQPAPIGNISRQPDADAQYPGYPQHHDKQRQGQKPVGGVVCRFGECQQQRKSEPGKQGSQQGQVVQGDMECIGIQG